MAKPEAGVLLSETAANKESLPLLDPAEMERLAHEYARTRNPQVRETLILHHQRLVKSIAARFLNNGESLEDLVQVGNIGLINALDRYDPDQGTRFSTYATPTILGEIKRHFRDKTCGIKVPRWLQELHQAARRASQQLSQELDRSPSVGEVAQRLGATEEETLQALESGEIAASLVSLESSPTPTGTFNLAEMVGRADGALYDLETFGGLRAAFASLNEREREILRLRFFDELSQARIAQQLNISQMHVSRLQKRGLERLHALLTTHDLSDAGAVRAAWGYRASV